MAVFDLLLERRTKNRLNQELTKKALKDIAAVVTRHRSAGFIARVDRLPDEPPLVMDNDLGGEVYQYRVGMRIEKHNVTDEQAVAEQFNHLYKLIERLAKKKGGWSVERTRVDMLDQELNSTAIEHLTRRPDFVLPELNEDAWRAYFSNIYERDPHIRIIYDSAKTFYQTRGQQRSNVILFGPPAAGKTSLFEQFKAFMEQDSEVERVAIIDGPTMSKAGLENWILERAEMRQMPEFLVIEEIEKQDMNNLLTLLSVMASGYVSKMNANVGRVKADARCVVWATCNDEQVLKKFQRGAIWSRFVHQLYCRRPSEKLMELILTNKVRERHGKVSWVKAVMKFAYHTYKEKTGKPLDDPRKIIGLLDGGDRLIDNSGPYGGSYQEDMMEIWACQEADENPVYNQDNDEEEDQPIAGRVAARA